MKYNKLVMALFSAAGVVASSNYLTGDVQRYFTLGIAVVGAFLVYWVPNLKDVAGTQDVPAPVDYVGSDVGIGAHLGVAPLPEADPDESDLIPRPVNDGPAAPMDD